MNLKPAPITSDSLMGSSLQGSRVPVALTRVIESLRKAGKARDIRLWKDRLKLPSTESVTTPVEPQQSPAGFVAPIPLRVDPSALEVFAELGAKGFTKVDFPTDVSKPGTIFAVHADGTRERIGSVHLERVRVEDQAQAGLDATGLHVHGIGVKRRMLEFTIRVPSTPGTVRAGAASQVGGRASRLDATVKQACDPMFPEAVGYRDTDTSEEATPSLSQIESILQGTSMLSPTPLKSGALLSPFAGQLDNVAWVDFNEIRAFSEPVVRSKSDDSGTPSYSMMPRELRELLLRQQGDADDARQYDKDFNAPFWAAVASGVRDVAVPYLKQGIPVEPVILDDPQSGELIARWKAQKWVEGSWQTVDEEKRVNLKNAVDRLFSNLAYADLADMADTFFSIGFASTSDTWAARKSFFWRVRAVFAQDPAGTPPLGGYWALRRTYGFEGALNDSTVPERVAGLWQRLMDALTNEFGTGSEDLGALEDAMVFRPPPVPSEHPFETYAAGEVNIGLRLVYRQEWRPLGIQRGEVVRTIPLGPKQTERVSTKLTRRTKVSRTSEDLQSTERTTETSDVRKDSADVVNEAARAMKWNLNQDIDGGFNAGIWHVGAKTSIGYGSESTQSNKETSSRLSEVMQKTASKIRTESKIAVSTESETTYESTSATEIQNPNEEIAITYVYSKLQTQYEVLTRLAEIQSVVMVAEELPKPQDIDSNWVRKHDWILAKVLLDDSFREALNAISREVPEPDLSAIQADLKTTRTGAMNALSEFSKNTGAVSADQVDFAGESQRAYNATARERLEFLRARYTADATRHRLFQHIRDNLLHYLRAIWHQEDAQQRLLRYRKSATRVPLDWYFSPDVPPSMTFADFVTRFDGKSATEIMGRYLPNPNSSTVSLSDLINPAGPIGFYGNYALYYLRPEFATGSTLMTLLDVFKQPYVRYDEERREAVVVDPVKQQIQDRLSLEGPVLPGTMSSEELKSLQLEMLDFVPDLRLEYLQAKALDDRSPRPQYVASFFADLRRFEDQLAEFQFRKQQCRRFVVDNNNLIIDILPGEGSALEPFKQAHRMVDVLKADEERRRLRIENERRYRLVEGDSLGDPDVDRVVVVEKDLTSMSSVVVGETDSRLAGAPAPRRGDEL